MLTKRQNLWETIKGGNPDRFVNQYEAIECQPGTPFGMILASPLLEHNSLGVPGERVVNGWGVTIDWPSHVPGPLPLHNDEVTVVKDITKWRDVVKAPPLDFPEKEWAPYLEETDKIDRNEVFASIFVVPGVFEQAHALMGMDQALLNMYAEPEAMKELIEFITEFELQQAKVLCEHFKPDCLFHHDDWGSNISSMMSPEMFKDFFVEPYKKIYNFYRENGVELVIHHNDSYSANLVPHMIDIGIDIWQGCVSSNNVPELVKKYGEKISFMGDIDNTVVDIEHWTPELIEREVRRACTTNGKHYFIPCCSRGGPGSLYPGAYEAVSEAIDRMSEELF